MTTDTPQSKEWIYAVFSDPKKDGPLLGQKDPKTGKGFVPAFETKEAAFTCLPLLTREPGKDYQVQAVHEEDLKERVKTEGFEIWICDGEGKLIRRITH